MSGIEHLSDAQDVHHSLADVLPRLLLLVVIVNQFFIHRSIFHDFLMVFTKIFIFYYPGNPNAAGIPFIKLSTL